MGLSDALCVRWVLEQRRASMQILAELKHAAAKPCGPSFLHVGLRPVHMAWYC